MERASRLILSMVLLLTCLGARPQEFFNLTAQEVKIDSLLPLFTYTRELGTGYADSTYLVEIDYPEFIDMSAADIERYRHISSEQLPEMPRINQYIGVARKRGTLFVSFVPLVYRDGKYQKLVSFKLSVTPQAVAKSRRAGEPSTGTRYADHSVLSAGRWAKIRVSTTGVHQLSDDIIRQAGFSDPAKVRIYGYGGALQPEYLTGDYLADTDDLKEVPTCTVGGRRLFYAVGTVGWDSQTAVSRTRNPYSDYGYYFLTEGDTTPLTQSETEFQTANYPAATDYHSLYETDDFAWYHGGRNLYDSQLFGTDVQRNYTMEAPAGSTGKLTVVLSYDEACTATILVNGTSVGTFNVTIGPDSYSKGAASTRTFTITEPLQASNTITIRQTSGSNLRLDYMSLQYDTPRAWPDLQSASLPVPEFVGNISCQDHHSDTAAEMIIIIPASGKLLSEAQRLAAFHESFDNLHVRIIRADELFNEFSSGTPDANAYRRYMKMLYDRAETDADMPRFLLLLGDGAWDNRMLSSVWRNCSPDDFLLCYESENSFSETDCYLTDDYYCFLDDNEGGSLLVTDKGDIAVGRLTARTAEQAKVMVDKIISYIRNDNAGPWQNTICMMGDDGNSNRHMSDADAVAAKIAEQHPELSIKKIYWDAYQRQTSSTGFSYPEVTQLIQQQMKNGALIMNYSGHGAPYVISHEQVLHLSDFQASSSGRLPLWLTASCDIMPFDGQEDNIGETAMLNANGGAIAFYGTTRTVYANYNYLMNTAFMRYVLGSDANGRRYTIGEAARLAKNLLVTSTRQGNDIGLDQTPNKMQFSLLGDPALTLAMPTMKIVVDSIRSVSAQSQPPVELPVGQPVTIKGHIVGSNSFKGVVTATVRDIEQTITCRLNDPTEATGAFSYKDRVNTLYTGSDSVRNGQFSISFVLSRDISHNEGTGLITLYAVSNNQTGTDTSQDGNRVTSHGYYDNFTMGATGETESNGIGPSIYCYLNSSSFVSGDEVNTTPLFHAELYDQDGINVSEGGIGHNMELIIDGALAQTYVLNDYFQFDFGDYRSGSLNYSLPALTTGPHKLLFRAWDVLNNSSTVELPFTVVKGLEPQLFSIDCTKNPAKTETTFVISHDRIGAQVDVQIDVFDTSGRYLWSHQETGLAADQSYTVSWDLCTSGGHRLQTGVYLYRVLLSSEGSTQASKAKKLIILKQ